MYKSLKIDEKIHKEMKIYCVRNDFKIKEWLEEIIKKELENGNNK